MFVCMRHLHCYFVTNDGVVHCTLYQISDNYIIHHIKSLTTTLYQIFYVQLHCIKCCTYNYIIIKPFMYNYIFIYVCVCVYMYVCKCRIYLFVFTYYLYSFYSPSFHHQFLFSSAINKTCSLSFGAGRSGILVAALSYKVIIGFQLLFDT